MRMRIICYLFLTRISNLENMCNDILNIYGKFEFVSTYFTFAMKMAMRNHSLDNLSTCLFQHALHQHCCEYSSSFFFFFFFFNPGAYFSGRASGAEKRTTESFQTCGELTFKCKTKSFCATLSNIATNRKWALEGVFIVRFCSGFLYCTSRHSGNMITVKKIRFSKISSKIILAE